MTRVLLPQRYDRTFKRLPNVEYDRLGASSSTGGSEPTLFDTCGNHSVILTPIDDNRLHQLVTPTPLTVYNIVAPYISHSQGERGSAHSRKGLRWQ